MSNNNKINLDINDGQHINFEYTKYSRFSTFDKSINFEIKELEVIISGKDYNSIEQDPIKISDIYDNKSITTHRLINSINIENVTTKDIFVSINHGNLFKIKSISILEAKNCKREINIIGLCKLISNDDTYNKYKFDTNNPEIALTKPLLCSTTLKENEIDDETVYIIPEFNLLFSCNKNNLEIILNSQSISIKYRSLSNENITIEKDERTNTQITYNQVLKNFSIGYNIIINDPNNYLNETGYYTYINDNIIKLFIEKNNLMKPGVYLISSQINDNVYIHELSLKKFRDIIINDIYVIEIKNIKFYISNSKFKLKCFLDQYKKTFNYHDIYNEEISSLKNELKTCKKEIVEYQQEIKQKNDEIAILNNRLTLENKKHISDNSIKRAEQLAEKEKIAYDKLLQTYKADIYSTNLKSYISIGVSVCGLATAIIMLLRKSK